jgi:short-subunit dehydrogenase
MVCRLGGAPVAAAAQHLESLRRAEWREYAVHALCERDLIRAGRRERREGRILNVASTAAFQAGPLMAVYYATKAYVLSFSEALAEELRGSGVTVTALCPGTTASGFQARAEMESSRLVKGRTLARASDVAGIGYRAMQRGDVVVVPGLRNKILASSVRVTPRPVLRRLVHRLQKPTS